MWRYLEEEWDYWEYGVVAQCFAVAGSSTENGGED
jgi:hypothetical protein